MRFVVVQHVQPWCGKMYGEAAACRGNPHEIATAAFARRIGGNDFYVEASWGGRHGRGRVMRVAADGELSEEEVLWLS